MLTVTDDFPPMQPFGCAVEPDFSDPLSQDPFDDGFQVGTNLGRGELLRRSFLLPSFSLLPGLGLAFGGLLPLFLLLVLAILLGILGLLLLLLLPLLAGLFPRGPGIGFLLDGILGVLESVPDSILAPSVSVQGHLQVKVTDDGLGTRRFRN